MVIWAHLGGIEAWFPMLLVTVFSMTFRAARGDVDEPGDREPTHPRNR